MKTTVIVFILFLSLLSGCEPKGTHKKAVYVPTLNKINGYPIFIIEVDSCEYLTSGVGYSQMVTHKGNCKFCIKRNEDLHKLKTK